MAVIAGGCILAGLAHELMGTRWILPRLFLLPAFAEMFPPTPHVKTAFRMALHVGSLGIAAFAAVVWIIELGAEPDDVEPLLVTLAILLSASPMVVGSYFGLLLRSKTRHLGTWFTVLLWILLAIVVVAAWRAAQPEVSGRDKRPNNELQRTRPAQAMEPRR